MEKLQAMIFTVFLVAATSAVAQPTEENGGNTDVQVLQAWYGQAINSHTGFGSDRRPILRVDFATCSTLSSETPEQGAYAYAKRDCRKALKEAARLDGVSSQLSPVIGSYVEDTYWSRSRPSPTGAQISSRFFGCATVELRTVTPVSIVQGSTFEGLGVYLNGVETFVPKLELHEVGRATLKDGRPAIVHRFVGVDLCKVSGASKYSAQVTSFNAYALYAGGRYKRWELAERNHEIGYANGNTTSNGSGWGNRVKIIPSSFDRQDEILRK